MAFANDVKPFGQNIQFGLGERVKIIIDDIDPKEVNVNTGIICKMDVHHLQTPKLRRIMCTVWMDGEYFKKPMMKGLGQQFTTDIDHIEKITN